MRGADSGVPSLARPSVAAVSRGSDFFFPRLQGFRRYAAPPPACYLASLPGLALRQTAQRACKTEKPDKRQLCGAHKSWQLSTPVACAAGGGLGVASERQRDAKTGRGTYRPTRRPTAPKQPQ